VKIKVSDYIADFLHAQEIDCVFEMAGGMITHILDSLHRRSKINIISVHHEQSASFAVDAHGRITGKPGVALATSGPGATNLLTGIGSCYFDSSPGLFITGQVNLHEQKGDGKIRQLGFQETDIVSMAEPITKKCFRVITAESIPAILQEAYKICISDRPGPVLIDLPMNLQRVEIEAEVPQKILANKYKDIDILSELKQLVEAIKLAKRPLVLAGAGINCAQAKQEFLKFIELINIPVVTSLLGLDVLAFDHPLRVGFIGSYGNRWANIALGTCDLLLVIGSRLDIRQTGADTKGFAENKKIFQVDCLSEEVNNRVLNCIPIIVDIKFFLEMFIKNCEEIKFNEPKEWNNEIKTLQNKWLDIKELGEVKGINPNYFIHLLSQYSKKAIGYVADVGSHQMWSAQSLELTNNQRFITSGGMGAMGFALPASIGFSFAGYKTPVVVIAGDGGFQLNIQELQTIVRNKLPIKIIILNNKNLGMIRQFQDSYFEGRYQSTYWGYSAPNFEAIAKAYEISAKTISASDEIISALEWLWTDPNLPALLQVMIDPYLNVYPKIAFGKPITEMEPFSKPIEMEGT